MSKMGESCTTWLRRGISVFFEYDTPKIVHIRSKKVGVTSRFVQACILSYIIGYVIVYQKGYQQFDDVASAATSKLKGVALTNFSDAELASVPVAWRPLYRRIWDVCDFVTPPQENNAFFVTTNAIITPNQTQSTCAEDRTLLGAKDCDPNDPASWSSVCVPGESLSMGHGVNTGRCVAADDGSGNYTCEVLAWCPVERDVKPLGEERALLQAAENFTVLLKNQIEFKLYNKRRSNILDSSNQTYLASCLYDNVTDPFCPVFRLGTIVALAGEDFSRLAVNGAVISVGIEWNCNLDMDFMEHCKPVYRFRRLDSPDAKIAPGWNFRYAHYFGDGDRRILFKAYGILFVVNVQGRAGKFSMIPLLINLGAGLALLGITTVICDIIVLYFMRDREIYWDKKFLQVKGSDAFSVYRNIGGSEEDISTADNGDNERHDS